jgi:hypothetical protein
MAYSLGVAVETYVIALSKSKLSLRQRALSVLLPASIYFFVMLALNFLWLSHYERSESVREIALRVLFISLFWGVSMAFVPMKFPQCRLLVDDQSVTSVMECTGWMKWHAVRRTVSAGKVRTIREIKGRFGGPGGLVASERTGWRAWMWGGIFVPRTLPEYEQLKALVEGWRARE